MERSSKFYLKDCYICDFCRNICKGPCTDLKEKINKGILKPGMKEYEDNKDLASNRKQIIKCLGKYCDKKCELNNENAEIDPQILINTIKFLGNYINDNIKKFKNN